MILGIALVAGLATPAAAQTVWHASYYGSELAGRKTASGERFNPGGLTAAHRTLPFGTQLKLTNMRNGRSVIVRVNDRGPFVRGRLLDVSRGAAVALGFIGQGTAQLRVEPMPGRAKMAEIGSSASAVIDSSAKAPEPEQPDQPPESENLVSLADRALQN